MHVHIKQAIKCVSTFGLIGIAALLSTQSACAQGPAINTTVQLPVLRFFNVRTVVSVPDGGTMSLGGVSRHASGQSSRGIPGLRGPLFNSRSRGYSGGSSRATVSTKIISNREIEEDLMQEANRRIAIRETFDANGPVAVQKKADFISRNIGRSKR